MNTVVAGRPTTLWGISTDDQIVLMWNVRNAGRFERLLLGDLDWYAEHAASWKPQVDHCNLFRCEVIDDFAECLNCVS